jgi:hypothetical protein
VCVCVCVRARAITSIYFITVLLCLAVAIRGHMIPVAAFVSRTTFFLTPNDFCVLMVFIIFLSN